MFSLILFPANSYFHHSWIISFWAKETFWVLRQTLQLQIGHCSFIKNLLYVTKGSDQCVLILFTLQESFLEGRLWRRSWLDIYHMVRKGYVKVFLRDILCVPHFNLYVYIEGREIMQLCSFVVYRKPFWRQEGMRLCPSSLDAPTVFEKWSCYLLKLRFFITIWSHAASLL